MSKIDAYQAKKREAGEVRSKILKAMGRHPDTGQHDRNNDKHRCRVSFVEVENGTWKPIRLRLEMVYGFYSSSSGYRASGENVGAYMARAINKHMGQIAQTAIELAEADAEKARVEAEEEARSVLSATAAS